MTKSMAMIFESILITIMMKAINKNDNDIISKICRQVPVIKSLYEAYSFFWSQKEFCRVLLLILHEGKSESHNFWKDVKQKNPQIW